MSCTSNLPANPLAGLCLTQNTQADRQPDPAFRRVTEAWEKPALPTSQPWVSCRETPGLHNFSAGALGFVSSEKTEVPPLSQEAGKVWNKERVTDLEGLRLRLNSRPMESLPRRTSHSWKSTTVSASRPFSLTSHCPHEHAILMFPLYSLIPVWTSSFRDFLHE